MILMIVSVAVHTTHGLQVVIEDYVHNRKAEMISLMLIKAVAAFLSVAAIVSVLRIVFAGA